MVQLSKIVLAAVVIAPVIAAPASHHKHAHKPSDVKKHHTKGEHAHAHHTKHAAKHTKHGVERKSGGSSKKLKRGVRRRELEDDLEAREPGGSTKHAGGSSRPTKFKRKDVEAREPGGSTKHAGHGRVRPRELEDDVELEAREPGRRRLGPHVRKAAVSIGRGVAHEGARAILGRRDDVEEVELEARDPSIFGKIFKGIKRAAGHILSREDAEEEMYIAREINYDELD